MEENNFDALIWVAPIYAEEISVTSNKLVAVVDKMQVSTKEEMIRLVCEAIVYMIYLLALLNKLNEMVYEACIPPIIRTHYIASPGEFRMLPSQVPMLNTAKIKQ